MKVLHRVQLKDQTFSARSGQTLLDAALSFGIDMPHDCRAGRCGACITKLKHGIVLGGETLQPGMIHACQARVFSDLALAIEDTPPVRSVEAEVVAVTERARDIVEVKMSPSKAFEIWPGQYCRFAFRGYPARAFSPTAPLDGTPGGDEIRLHVKRVRDGRVTPQLGTKILAGHQVVIEGPFGHGYLRPGGTGRLVLVGTGTGFAPIWAVADAALRENPRREVVIVTGARSLAGFYMGPALNLARQFPNVHVIASTAERVPGYPSLHVGDPLDHMPAFVAADTVYAAGAPRMVEELGRRACEAGATFHSDPFVSDGAPTDWITRVVDWMRTG